MMTDHAEPVAWFADTVDFDRFIGMLQSFRRTLPDIPQAFRQAFEG